MNKMENIFKLSPQQMSAIFGGTSESEVKPEEHNAGPIIDPVGHD